MKSPLHHTTRLHHSMLERYSQHDADMAHYPGAAMNDRPETGARTSCQKKNDRRMGRTGNRGNEICLFGALKLRHITNAKHTHLECNSRPELVLYAERIQTDLAPVKIY